jgi:all-trans-8'-apo-beta-carotenal 15,15'-oxygenase
MTKIMRGEQPTGQGLRASGVYRAILDYDKNHISYGSNYFKCHGVEMPTIDARRAGKPYENAYFIAGQEGFDNQIVHLNVTTKEIARFDFGPNRFVTEPIFAPGAGDNGYLLSEVYNHLHKKSYLAVFDAKDISKGPMAEVWLKHHLPIGFHGCWQPG